MSDDFSSRDPFERSEPSGAMETTEAHRGDARRSDARRDDAHSLSATDSPCVAVCSTLYDDICRGCGRTAMEVANWVFLDDTERRQVRERIAAQGYPKRKG